MFSFFQFIGINNNPISRSLINVNAPTSGTFPPPGIFFIVTDDEIQITDDDGNYLTTG